MCAEKRRKDFGLIVVTKLWVSYSQSMTEDYTKEECIVLFAVSLMIASIIEDNRTLLRYPFPYTVKCHGDATTQPAIPKGVK